MVFTAIGQTGAPDIFGPTPPTMQGGKIVVDEERRTSLAKVWAGGDCVAGGLDLTVSAVEDGKRAAESIDRGAEGIKRRAVRHPRAQARPGIHGRRECALGLVRNATCGALLSMPATFARGMTEVEERAIKENPMVDLRTSFLGIKSPNPFWLASAPPTDRKTNVERAFRAGWGGVVWKTLGEAGPPVVNVSGPRYGAMHGPDRRLIAFNNIELITDRDLEINLQEIKQVKREWPDRALVASLMVPCDEDSWKKILARVEETECDGVELNFGCPHGMSERGMGSAVGQVPEYIEMVTRWCKQHAHAGHRQADAQHHRRPPAGARRARRAAPTRCRSSTPSTRSWASISTR